MPSLAVSPQQSIVERAASIMVPANVETIINTFVVLGGTMWLDAVECTGTFAAEWRFYFNGQHEETKRQETGDQSPVFTFHSRRVKRGDVLEARVVHYDPGNAPRDFEATMKLHR